MAEKNKTPPSIGFMKWFLYKYKKMKAVMQKEKRKTGNLAAFFVVVVLKLVLIGQAYR